MRKKIPESALIEKTGQINAYPRIPLKSNKKDCPNCEGVGMIGKTISELKDCRKCLGVGYIGINIRENELIPCECKEK